MFSIFYLKQRLLFFPLGSSTVASKYEELECLYAAVGKVIYEGLTNYEKATSNTNPTQLFGKTSSSLALAFYKQIYSSLSPRALSISLLFINTVIFYFSHSHPFLYKTKPPLSHLQQLRH